MSSLLRALGTVRVRTTAASVFVVGVALLIGAATVVTGLRTTLTDNVRTASRYRAEEVAATLRAGAEPDLTVSAQDEQLIQILDVHGRVLASSANLRGRPAVAHLEPGRSKEVLTPVDEDRFLVVAVGADTPSGSRVVLVGRALADVMESVHVLTQMFAVGIPLLLLLVGVTTWLVVGRALAPVAAIRREVDAISAAELHRRVPEPPAFDEIARLAHTMNRMLVRLQAAQDAQRQFVADASHELRTPITTIRQYAELALAHPEKSPTIAEPVQAEALRIQRLVDDLLTLARSDEAALALRHDPVDLDDLVFAEARRLRAEPAGSDTRRLRIDTSEVSAARVTGDEASLRRVVGNLADNAARHADSAVSFGLVQRNGTVTLTVDDDGPGIPADQRERVLGRFVRLDDARGRGTGGSGLGLAIVSELVAAHRGTVHIGASPGGGARVTVTFVQDQFSNGGE